MLTRLHCHYRHMTTSEFGPEHRTGVMMRVTVAEREQLKERAHQAGVSLQVYMENKLLGRELVDRRPGRPRTPEKDEPLPMTG